MICKYCGKEFSGKPIQKYCSVQCRNRFWGSWNYNKNRHTILNRMKTKEYRAKESIYNKTPKRRKWHREYCKNKRRTDPIFRLHLSIIDRIRHEFPDIKNVYRDIELYLGYSIKSLWEHLIKNLPNCTEDYLSRRLEIDHIIPYGWFIVINVGDNEFKKCWNKRNLRLIPSNINRRRNRNINWELIKNMGLEDILPRGADVIYKEICKN